MSTPLHLACYEDLKAWLRRRRRTILIAAGALGAGGLLYYGATRYYRRAPAAAALPRARTAGSDEDSDRAIALRHHFEAIQVIGDTTTLPTSLQHFRSKLSEVINLSELTQKLMAGREGAHALNHSEKMFLWQKLKICSFTRALCAAWGMGLVHVFVRIQLNLLGKHMYISSAMKEDEDEEFRSSAREGGLLQDLPMSAQHKFLAFADYFPCHGIHLLVEDISQVVEEVLHDVSLKKPYSFDELNQLFIRIQADFEKQSRNWARYMLPQDGKLPEDLEAASSSSDIGGLSFPEQESPATLSTKYEQLLDQLRLVLDSAEFRDVLGAAFDTIQELMVRELLPHYQEQPAVPIPLAKLVPAVSSLGSQMLDGVEGSKYIQAVATLHQLNTFCAMVYGGTGT